MKTHMQRDACVRWLPHLNTRNSPHPHTVRSSEGVGGGGGGGGGVFKDTRFPLLVLLISPTFAGGR